MDVPVGTTNYGYSFNTKTCSIFSDGRGREISKTDNITQINPGDVIGCLIKLSGIPYNLEDPRNYPHLHPYLELGLLCNPEVLPKVVRDPGKFSRILIAIEVLLNFFLSFQSNFGIIETSKWLIIKDFILTLSDSIIEFFVNGKKLSASFSNIASGFYHPTVSLYMGSSVKINTGPDFAFFPHIELEPASKLLRPQIP